MQAEPYPPDRLSIRLEGSAPVSGLLLVPDPCSAGLVLAHGAGAGMSHAFMAATAAGLHARGVATLRYQFPYMERGSRRPDGPAVAQATVRAAVDEADRRLAGVPLFAGGKSFGGRMTSQAQAAAALPNVRGIAFLGFPLHPAGKPGVERAAHLSKAMGPMLFLSGTRDALADLTLLRPIVNRSGGTLHVLEGADHSMARHVRELAKVTRAWIDRRR